MFVHETLPPQALRAASELLNISEGRLLSWARSGVLPEQCVVRTMGGHRRYYVQKISEWLNQEKITF